LQQYQYSETIGEKYKEIYYIPEHITLIKVLEDYKKRKNLFKLFIRDNVIGYRNIREIKNTI
jgi:Mg2+/Co2+ transporter CorB